MSQDNGHPTTHSYFELAPDVWGIKDIFVNMYMIRNSDDDTWVLIDTGLKSSAKKILKIASELFRDTPPEAIILTHGHFDHTGSATKLAEEWQVPVYAHYLELPYLIGKSSYPPPDPSVGGGLLSWASFLYPNHPINIETILNVLPDDGVVPFLNEWKYLHTPGHAPGHISLFRESDRVLIAGDAFVTTVQESVTAVISQKKALSGPPKYLTYDWDAAYESVEKLVLLQPEVVGTGHGKPMKGAEMRDALNSLYVNFYEEAVPNYGRYINDPAVADASGVIYLPSREKKEAAKWWAIGGAIVLSAAVLLLVANRRKRKQ